MAHNHFKIIIAVLHLKCDIPLPVAHWLGDTMDRGSEFYHKRWYFVTSVMQFHQIFKASQGKIWPFDEDKLFLFFFSWSLQVMMRFTITGFEIAGH